MRPESAGDRADPYWERRANPAEFPSRARSPRATEGVRDGESNTINPKNIMREDMGAKSNDVEHDEAADFAVFNAVNSGLTVKKDMRANIHTGAHGVVAEISAFTDESVENPNKSYNVKRKESVHDFLDVLAQKDGTQSEHVGQGETEENNMGINEEGWRRGQKGLEILEIIFSPLLKWKKQ